MAEHKHALNSIADIRQYFAQNRTPYYFISATNFNLMGMHDWVNGWRSINLLDCFDSQNPHVLIPDKQNNQVFDCIEDINLYLMQSPSISGVLTGESEPVTTRGKVIFLFFDERLEALCEKLKLDILLPKNSLVMEVDSKIVTTEIGNRAGVPSVPNVLTKLTSYGDLLRVAAEARLGNRWVIQTAYGDSGKTTFFISSEADYQAASEKIEAEDKVKVMRRINCIGTAIEACATRWGTFVGPLLTELIGIESLTPYSGGWCGNELYQDAFSAKIRQEILSKTQAMGDALYQYGYRGYFEVDYLIDMDSQELYLGELNARITGISAMTNLSDFSADNIPLFLFHLLEFDTEVALGVDPGLFNQAVLERGAAGRAAQLILKYTEEQLKVITHAPQSGVYKYSAGQLSFLRPSYNRRDAMAEDECYVLRIMEAGEYAYKGGDLAIIFLNQSIRTSNGQLNADGERWTEALKNSFQFRHLNQEERSLIELARNPANLKSGGAQ